MKELEKFKEIYNPILEERGMKLWVMKRKEI